MPVVKAPRSFVLPREMAKQPKHSIFAWYPTLRLATALAAIAFVVLFAGDMLLSRSGGGSSAFSSVPMAAPAPQQEQATAMQAPAATMVAAAAPTEAPAPEFSNTAAATAPGAAPMAGAAAKTVPTETITVTDATAIAVVTPAMTAVAAAPQPPVEATPEPAADAQAKRAATSAIEQPIAAPTAVAPTPTIDPLRVLEIAVLALAIGLGIATLIVRRKQV